MTDGLVPLTEEAIKKYLDDAIGRWRVLRSTAADHENEHTCACYVDAFQSVRTSLFGELLP